jgi:hypothetical protein
VKVGVPKPEEGNGHRRGRQRSERRYEEECWRRLRQKIREAQAGTVVDRSKDRLFSTQAEAWLAEQEHTLRDRSLENYRSIVVGHLIPALGQLMLSEVTRDAVTRMLAEKARPRTVRLKDGTERRKPGLSKARLGLFHTITMACLKAAKNEGRPVADAVLGLKAPSLDKKPRFAASPEQSDSLGNTVTRHHRSS